MDHPTIKDDVRKHYAAIADRGCCGPDCCAPQSETAWIPEDATTRDDPSAEADLGSGAALRRGPLTSNPGNTFSTWAAAPGADVFRAAAAVGPTGRVIGVDMTPEMVDRARHIAAERPYTNVEFRLGDIESLPVKSASVDAILSNCVLNLVPDKPQAFAEMYRVLRPGGRFVVSDIVTRGALPEFHAQGCRIVGGLPGRCDRRRGIPQGPAGGRVSRI